MDEVATNKSKKEKSLFKLNLDWTYSKPIDLEHKQYVLLDFLKYCDRKIDKFEIYPVYTELSVHLANLQSISSDFKTIHLEKTIKNLDDEILLSDLKFVPVPITDENEFNEFNEIIKYAGQRVLDYFNMVKAVWTIVYDSISITPVLNVNNLADLVGYFYYVKDGERLLWKYQIEKRDRLTIDTKMNIIKMKPQRMELNLEDIIYELDKSKNLPIFELQTTMDFPMETSLIPAFKRKVLNHIIQKNVIKNLKKNKKNGF